MIRLLDFAKNGKPPGNEEYSRGARRPIRDYRKIPREVERNQMVQFHDIDLDSSLGFSADPVGSIATMDLIMVGYLLLSHHQFDHSRYVKINYYLTTFERFYEFSSRND